MTTAHDDNATSWRDLDVTITPLPPVPAATGTEFARWDTYATIRLGALHAEVVRFSYWDPRDGHDTEFAYEVHVDDLMDAGLSGGSGCHDIVVEQADRLVGLAAVCQRAAELLAKVRS